jgi:TolB-like protein/Tfp pilus assembly protein PilF
MMEVLVYLAQNQRVVVSKEQLMRVVWPDTFVTDDVLTRCISELRRALEDDPKEPSFIETIPKRGYRIIAQITPLYPPRNRWLRLTLSVAAVGLTAIVIVIALWHPSHSIRSIAVLPFRNLSNDPAEEYFAAGITYSVTNQLAQINALQVTSYTSASAYKDSKKSLQAIANDLKVDAIVEGAVMRSGGRTSVNVQLIDAQRDRQLWARDFRVEQSSVIALAGESARQIAAVVRAELTPMEEARLARPVTSNPSAYEAYLRGRYFWGKYSSSNWKQATQYFRQATELDPNYADAYVGLADCYLLMASYAPVRGQAHTLSAKAAIDKALALDASLAEAHFSLAFMNTVYDYDWKSAESEFHRGFQLNPAYAVGHMWYSAYLSALGRNDEAVSEQKRAVELDPTSLVVNTNLGRAYWLAGQADHAIQQLQATLMLDPNFPLAHMWLSEAYLMKGMVQESVNEEEAWLRLSGDTDAGVDLQRAYSSDGYRGVLRWELETLLGDVNEDREEAFSVADAYAAIGNGDATFAWLDRAYNSRDGLLVFLKSWPRFDKLRSDPRYSDLVHRMGLPE